MDWKSNPKSIEYRSVGTTEAKTEGIENVAEFGITGGPTYRRHTVNIDRSTDIVERMDGNRNPLDKVIPILKKPRHPGTWPGQAGRGDPGTSPGLAQRQLF